ncbi:hypothetical protein M0804_003687 [Polistes exclamans]|nr:hypothetical protein M0804_003687 [Polistes exclamans]
MAERQTNEENYSKPRSQFIQAFLEFIRHSGGGGGGGGGGSLLMTSHHHHHHHPVAIVDKNLMAQPEGKFRSRKSCASDRGNQSDDEWIELAMAMEMGWEREKECEGVARQATNPLRRRSISSCCVETLALHVHTLLDGRTGSITVALAPSWCIVHRAS